MELACEKDSIAFVGVLLFLWMLDNCGRILNRTHGNIHTLPCTSNLLGYGTRDIDCVCVCDLGHCTFTPLPVFTIGFVLRLEK